MQLICRQTVNNIIQSIRKGLGARVAVVTTLIYFSLVYKVSTANNKLLIKKDQPQKKVAKSSLVKGSWKGS
jgi:hypothetical protein